jgi:hypothetical protein
MCGKTRLNAGIPEFTDTLARHIGIDMVAVPDGPLSAMVATYIGVRTGKR